MSQPMYETRCRTCPNTMRTPVNPSGITATPVYCNRCQKERDAASMREANAALMVENRRLTAQVDEPIERCSKPFDDGWKLAHELRTCGHPRACYLDENYPESERNYDPETRTSDPPMEYRCVMCVAVKENQRLREELAAIRAAVAEAYASWIKPGDVSDLVTEFAPMMDRLAALLAPKESPAP